MKIICFLFQACAPFVKVDYTMNTVRLKNQIDYKAIEKQKKGVIVANAFRICKSDRSLKVS